VHGGELVAHALAAAGVDVVFTLVGGHTTPAVDACHQLGIRLVDVRHEEATTHMAHGYARATGLVGVALVTAGPGVTNAATGIANAWSGGSPVLLLAGGIPRPQVGRGALHEMDQVGFMRPITKASVSVTDVTRLPEAIACLLQEARSGRPGPVFAEVPSDVMRDEAPAPSVWPVPEAPGRPQVSADELSAAVGLLDRAERPLVIVGSGVFWSAAGEQLRQLVEKIGAPVVVSHAARGIIPSAHPSNIVAARSLAMREADAVLVVGSRINFMLAYGQPPRFAPEAPFVQIDIDPREIGRNRQIEIGLVGDARAVMAQLAEELQAREPGAWLAKLRAADVEARAKLDTEAGTDAVPIHPLRLCRELARVLAPDAYVVVDGGDILSFARQAVPVSSPGCWLDSGSFGCLGYGIASACAAKIAFPDRPAVALLGDGALGLQAMELDTAARHGLPILVVVSNNGAWAIEAASQEMEFGRSVATKLEARPYHLLAESLGCEGVEVASPAELRDMLARPLGTRPRLVNVLTDPSVRSPDARRGLGLVPRDQAIAF
jgi:acetolactate synthase-1/2/3 large subunit